MWSQSDGRPAGRPYIRLIDDDNTVNVVRHYYKSVQRELLTNRRRDFPLLRHNAAILS